MKTRSVKIKGFFATMFCALAFCGGLVFAEDIEENDVKVKPNTDLTYYINVTYDGKDEGKKDTTGDQTNVTDSEDTTAADTANVKSGYIKVEDKLPTGLDFKGFVENEGGIGATLKDGATCSGNVVQDSENIGGTTYNDEDEYVRSGLHYTKSDRTVRFTVNALQAGGKLTVGVITTTPSVEAEERKDFYNSANANEKSLSKRSNTVHAYIEGESNVSQTYPVTYQYTGDVIPDGANDLLPPEALYTVGDSVGVAAPITVEGYTFSGWVPKEGLAAGDVPNNAFTMPGNDVVFEGSFTKINPYKVTYEVNGAKPENYVEPLEKSYYADENVDVDSLAADSVTGGYKFRGWSVKSGGATISDGSFTMPAENVVLEGSFTQIPYEVNYEFYDYEGAVLPPNAENLLPESQTYVPCAQVTVANNPQTDGYTFLGWDKSGTFLMPEENVTLRGEWARNLGTFEPQISKEIVDKKDYYETGDTVEYKITVTNPYSFKITNVTISENNGKAKFEAGEGYKVTGDQLAEISEISENSSVVLTANYVVDENDSGIIENEVEFVSGIGENGYTLNAGEYKAKSEFTIRSTDPDPDPDPDPESEPESEEKNEHNKSENKDDTSVITDEEKNLNFTEGSARGRSSIWPKTGDETNVYTYILIAFVSIICFVMASKFGKSQKQNSKIN